MRRRFQGGLLGLIGFILSPLSWWNDAFVNLPLALGFAWLVALIYRPAFEPALIIGYLLTNVLGLFLLHKGAKAMLSSAERPKPYSKRDLRKDLLISLCYTLLIVLLLKLSILKPLGDYFPSKQGRCLACLLAMGLARQDTVVAAGETPALR